MKEYLKIHFWLLCCFVGCFQSMEVKSQKKGDCKQIVTKHFTSFQKVGMPSGKVVHHYRFTTYNEFLPEYGTTSEKIEMDVVIGGKYSMYESSYVSMYKDEKETYMLVHPQRTALIYSTEVDSLEDKKFEKNIAFQDSIYVKMSELQCEVIEYKGKKVWKGKFAPTKLVRDKYGITRVVTLVDPVEDRLLKIENFFEKPSKLKRQIVEYLETDLKYKGKLPKTAREKVFSQEGSILKRYQNYEVVDQRKNNKNR